MVEVLLREGGSKVKLSIGDPYHCNIMLLESIIMLRHYYSVSWHDMGWLSLWPHVLIIVSKAYIVCCLVICYFLCISL